MKPGLLPLPRSQTLAVFLLSKSAQGLRAGLTPEAGRREKWWRFPDAVFFSRKVHPLVTQIKSK
jgi:hypothetical protein